MGEKEKPREQLGEVRPEQFGEDVWRGKFGTCGYLQVSLNNREFIAVTETGNKTVNAIAPQTMEKIFGPGWRELLDQTFTGTFGSKIKLQILGQVRENMTLTMGPGNPGVKIRPIVVVGMGVEINLTVETFSQGLELDKNRRINYEMEISELPGTGRHGHRTFKAWAKGTQIITGRREQCCQIEVEQEEWPIEAREGLLWIQEQFRWESTLHAPIQCLVRLHQQSFWIPMFNSGQAPKQLEKGTLVGRIMPLGTTFELYTIPREISYTRPQELIASEDLRSQLRLESSPVLDQPEKMRAAQQLVEQFRDIFSYEEPIPTGKWQILGENPRPNTSSLPLPGHFPATLVQDTWGQSYWCPDFRKIQSEYHSHEVSHPHVRAGGLGASRIFSSLPGFDIPYIRRPGSTNPDSPPGTSSEPLRDEYPYEDFQAMMNGFLPIQTPFGPFPAQRQFRELHLALRTYGRMVERVLSGLPMDFARPYVGDYCLHDVELGLHMGRLASQFKECRMAGITLDPTQCRLFRQGTEYAGFQVGRFGYQPSTKLMGDVCRLDWPSHVGPLRAIMGLIRWKQEFIPLVNTMGTPIFNLLHEANQDQDLQNLPRDDPAILAFQGLKTVFETVPSLTYFSANPGHICIMEAQTTGEDQYAEGILYQRQEGKEWIIRHGTVRLGTDAPQEPKALRAYTFGRFARLWAEYLRLVPIRIRLWHDQKELYPVRTFPCQLEWTPDLSNHELALVVRKGARSLLDRVEIPPLSLRLGSVPQCMRARPLDVGIFPSFQRMEIPFGDWNIRTDLDFQWIQRRLLLDQKPSLREIKFASRDRRIYWSLWETLRVGFQGLVLRVAYPGEFATKARICVPQPIQDHLIRAVHETTVRAHLSADDTCRTILADFYFPDVHHKVDQFILNCGQCGASLPSAANYQLAVDILDRGPGYQKVILVYGVEDRWVETNFCEQVNLSTLRVALKQFLFHSDLHPTSLGTGTCKPDLDLLRQAGEEADIAWGGNELVTPTEVFRKVLTRGQELSGEPWEILMETLLHVWYSLEPPGGFTPSYRRRQEHADLSLRDIQPPPELGKDHSRGYRRLYLLLVQIFQGIKPGTIRRQARCPPLLRDNSVASLGSWVWLYTPQLLEGHPWSGPWRIDYRISRLLVRIQPAQRWFPHASIVVCNERLFPWLHKQRPATRNDWHRRNFITHDELVEMPWSKSGPP